jgi:hypothetical protein
VWNRRVYQPFFGTDGKNRFAGVRIVLALNNFLVEVGDIVS